MEIRTAWKAAHLPVPGVPRWARLAALAVPLAVLPSGLWRLAVCVYPGLGGNAEALDEPNPLPWWFPVRLYIVLLSVVSELLAFTAVGLIARWGEVWPRWVPLLRGRRVPVAAAVVPGALGAVALIAVWGTFLVTFVNGTNLQGEPTADDDPITSGGWKTVVFVACYAPLLLWGPLLAAVTWAYWRRRRAEGGGQSSGEKDLVSSSAPKPPAVASAGRSRKASARMMAARAATAPKR
ncbi:hypothetical protein [Streptomyces boninensis]|uniref:hypothetical protein n=1 Tax=Streptomyces boninensis TaxID=2039455 RepID=UPI003B2174C2